MRRFPFNWSLQSKNREINVEMVRLSTSQSQNSWLCVIYLFNVAILSLSECLFILFTRMADITAQMGIAMNKEDGYVGICYKSSIMYQVLHCCDKIAGIDHSRKEGFIHSFRGFILVLRSKHQGRISQEGKGHGRQEIERQFIM